MINYQDKSNSREKGNIYLSSQFKASAPGDWEVKTTASHVVCTVRKLRARNAAAQPPLLHNQSMALTMQGFPH